MSPNGQKTAERMDIPNVQLKTVSKSEASLNPPSWLDVHCPLDQVPHGHVLVFLLVLFMFSEL